MDAIEVKNTQNELVKTYKHKPLPEELSRQYRQYFQDNIPPFLNVEGDEDVTLVTKNARAICYGYNRIVVGDYGAYVEFSPQQRGNSIRLKRSEMYRLKDQYKNVKYWWYTIEDRSEIKIYLQRNTVDYADYIPGMFYVSVYDVYNSDI